MSLMLMMMINELMILMSLLVIFFVAMKAFHRQQEGVRGLHQQPKNFLFGE